MTPDRPFSTRMTQIAADDAESFGRDYRRCFAVISNFRVIRGNLRYPR